MILLISGLLLLAPAAAFVLLRRSSVRSERDALARLPIGEDGIIPGAQAIELSRNTPESPAVLLLHGAGDTPQTLRYLAAFLHDRGYAVHAPLLPGHGRTVREFASVSADAWTNAAREHLRALRERHEWTAVVGLSMGGALAVQLAAETPDLPALGLLAPYLSMPLHARRAARWASLWGPLVPYVPALPKGSTRSIHDPGESAQSLSYGVFSARALHALWITVQRATDALPRVNVPTLMVQSREDNRISVAEGQRAFDRLGSRDKRLVWTEGAGHVLTVDYGKERVFALLAEWLDARRQLRQAIA
jgi:carboxylesterase